MNYRSDFYFSFLKREAQYPLLQVPFLPFQQTPHNGLSPHVSVMTRELRSGIALYDHTVWRVTT